MVDKCIESGLKWQGVHLNEDIGIMMQFYNMKVDKNGNVSKGEDDIMTQLQRQFYACSQDLLDYVVKFGDCTLGVKDCPKMDLMMRFYNMNVNDDGDAFEGQEDILIQLQNRYPECPQFILEYVMDHGDKIDEWRPKTFEEAQIDLERDYPDWSAKRLYKIIRKEFPCEDEKDGLKLEVKSKSATSLSACISTSSFEPIKSNTKDSFKDGNKNENRKENIDINKNKNDNNNEDNESEKHGLSRSENLSIKSNLNDLSNELMQAQYNTIHAEVKMKENEEMITWTSSDGLSHDPMLLSGARPPDQPEKIHDNNNNNNNNNEENENEKQVLSRSENLSTQSNLNDLSKELMQSNV
jgi:hypothetical protein